MRRLAVFVLFSVALVEAQAHAGGVRALALPTRQGAAHLRDIARATADALAARLGRRRTEDPPRGQLERSLRAALELAQSGRLEEATSFLEVSIARSLDALHLLGEGDLLLDAAVTLASIELARENDERASELLTRVIELDPGFELAAEEKSPRLIAALRAAHREHGREDPPLRVATLGRACGDGAETLVVARGTRDGRIELFRYDGCRLVARVRGTASDPAELLARSLDPSRALPADRPIYKRWWFWTGAGALVATGAVATFFLLREEPTTEVVPIPRLAW